MCEVDSGKLRASAFRIEQRGPCRASLNMRLRCLLGSSLDQNHCCNRASTKSTEDLERCRVTDNEKHKPDRLKRPNQKGIVMLF